MAATETKEEKEVRLKAEKAAKEEAARLEAENDGKEVTVSYRTLKGNVGERTFKDKKAAKEFANKFNGVIV